MFAAGVLTAAHRAGEMQHWRCISSSGSGNMLSAFFFRALTRLPAYAPGGDEDEEHDIDVYADRARNWQRLTTDVDLWRLHFLEPLCQWADFNQEWALMRDWRNWGKGWTPRLEQWYEQDAWLGHTRVSDWLTAENTNIPLFIWEARVPHTGALQLYSNAYNDMHTPSLAYLAAYHGAPLTWHWSRGYNSLGCDPTGFTAAQRYHQYARQHTLVIHACQLDVASTVESTRFEQGDARVGRWIQYPPTPDTDTRLESEDFSVVREMINQGFKEGCLAYGLASDHELIAGDERDEPEEEQLL